MYKYPFKIEKKGKKKVNSDASTTQNITLPFRITVFKNIVKRLLEWQVKDQKNTVYSV